MEMNAEVALERQRADAAQHLGSVETHARYVEERIEDRTRQFASELQQARTAETELRMTVAAAQSREQSMASMGNALHGELRRALEERDRESETARTMRDERGIMMAGLVAHGERTAQQIGALQYATAPQLNAMRETMNRIERSNETCCGRARERTSRTTARQT